jgi:SEC-C motif-containing protein
MTSSHQPCPCCSGRPYAQCCQKYHRGLLPKNALALMRSRYSAYALGLAEYIIETTHSDSPHWVANRKQWLHQIQAFSREVSFDGLEILETKNEDGVAFVAFVAHLSKEGTDLTFTEKSRFFKQGQAWKYVDGKIAKGHLTLEQIKHL